MTESCSLAFDVQFILFIDMSQKFINKTNYRFLILHHLINHAPKLPLAVVMHSKTNSIKVRYITLKLVNSAGVTIAAGGTLDVSRSLRLARLHSFIIQRGQCRWFCQTSVAVSTIGQILDSLR